MNTRVMEVENSVAANATNENVLSGQRFENMPFDGWVTVYETGSAAGLRSELNIGGQSVSPRMIVNAQNRSPVVPDDLKIVNAWGNKGDLIQYTVANTTAGALTHRARFEIQQAR